MSSVCLLGISKTASIKSARHFIYPHKAGVDFSVYLCNSKHFVYHHSIPLEGTLSYVCQLNIYHTEFFGWKQCSGDSVLACTSDANGISRCQKSVLYPSTVPRPYLST